MKDFLISQFIDDELDLKEKKEFVINIKQDNKFYNDTIEFIENEIVIRDHLNQKEINFKDVRIPKENIYTKFGIVAAVFTIGFIFIFKLWNIQNKDNCYVSSTKKEYRFVIYEDKADNVEITGTFTKWQKIKMKRIEGTKYWEAIIEIPKGEHRYTIIKDGQAVADPTAVYTEMDDFGNINSILEV